MTTKSLWFDMDGVLVEHISEDYNGQNPKWLEPDYFATLEKDKFACQFFETMRSTTKSNKENIHISILSKVHPDAKHFINQVRSKYKWIVNNLDDPFSINYVVTAGSKVKKATALLGRPLCAHDILIDDHNPNLEEWEKAGGTALKYGKGSPYSWSGTYLPREGVSLFDLAFLVNTLLK